MSGDDRCHGIVRLDYCFDHDDFFFSCGSGEAIRDNFNSRREETRSNGGLNFGYG